MKSMNYNVSAIIFYSVIMVLGWCLPNMAFATPIPDTGQTQSYTNTFGEDSDYTCNPHSYTDLGNGIVRDNVTGLEWVQDGNLIKTRDPGFDADETAGDGAVTWQHALNYVTKLNNENYLDHGDWRLPTMKELSSLVDRGRYFPSIDTTLFPGTETAFVYWSSSTSLSTGGPWHVEFGMGRVWANTYRAEYGYVRAVRSGQSESFGNLIINGDGTVTDTNTGLMWQQATAPGIGSGSNPTCYSWEEALTYCENLTLAGKSDWRLPNANELQSIVDNSRYNPTIDTTYFLGTVGADYWSSTTNAYSTGYTSQTAWCVFFYGGGVGDRYKTYPTYVRAVRGPVSNPTVITLITFTTTPKASIVVVEWSTETEIDNAGFNLYRAESENGNYIKINASLIFANGSSTQGSSYEFADMGVQNRKTYWYKLEDIDLSGTSTFHGPVSATPRLIYGMGK